MAYEKIVTAYDTEEHAEQAVHALKAAGYDPDDIHKFTSDEMAEVGEGAGDVVRNRGFWHRLFGRDLEEHEATVWGRTVGTGGVIVTLRVPDTDVARAMGILDGHKPIDVHERASSIGLAPVAVKPPPLAPQQPAAEALRTAAAEKPSFTAAADPNRIRLAEEHLNVGKRLVQTGTTRIRRFVVETPVEENVTLHEEHTEVLRRAVTDPAYVKDIDWGDQTIEVKETAEEAVVGKTARIVEEVDVRKVGSERVETVRDKVRRQQIEIERAGEQASKTPPPKPPQK
jgi:uncharacterized protein (TIGR02271 family)